MADVSKVNVNSTDYDIKDSNAMHKGVDYVTAGKQANTTLGSKATAEGYNTTASGSYSHAEGQNTIASGLNSHAEGSDTTASKPDAHAEGSHTTASGEQAHAEGSYTTASGYYAHSEGFYTTASGNHSHAEGVCTKASSPNQHVEGKYNVEDTNGTYAHIIGNGPSDSERKNIFTVNWDGDVNAGRSNGLTNDTKLPTGADVISYLNSNFGSVKTKAFLNARSIVIDLDRAPSAGHPITLVLFNFNTANQNFIVCGNNVALNKVWGASTFTFTLSLSGNTLTITPNDGVTLWGLTIAMWGQN